MTCSVCGGKVYKSSKYGICTRNPECKRANHRAYDQATPKRPLSAQERVQINARRRERYHVRRQHGAGTKPGACEACGAASGDMRLDHDHRCCKVMDNNWCGKCARGWLCNRCNITLGWALDDPARLRNLAYYLEARTGT